MDIDLYCNHLLLHIQTKWATNPERSGPPIRLKWATIMIDVARFLGILNKSVNKTRLNTTNVTNLPQKAKIGFFRFWIRANR